MTCSTYSLIFLIISIKYYEACGGILLARFCMIDTKMWYNLGHFLRVCVDFARACFFGYEPGN
jgi:hypothetical protein